jgi:N-acetylglucosaminyldiphosphoundecaprenol N-acetyl-beta-D-mannosaminyltransferase
MNTFHIKSIPISIGPKSAINAWAMHAIDNAPFTPVVTFNTTMIGAHDAPLRDWLIEHGIFFADGIGVSAFMLLRYGIHAPRYPGIELAETILGHHPGLRIALIGARPESLGGTIDWIHRTYPNHCICFSADGVAPLTPSDVLALSNANPALTLVALGCPKQELLMQQLAPVLDSGIAIGVGGSFDVWSGIKKRAPKGVRMVGLEWLYRLIKEPWRLPRLGRSLWAFIRH